MTQKNKATLAMVVTALMWSLGGVLFKLLSWNALEIAGIRSFISAAMLFIIIKKSGFRIRLNRTTAAIAVANCAVMVFFVLANRMTTAANAIVLQYTCPVWILLIGLVFYKEKAKRYDVAAVALCLVGMVLFFLDGISPGNAVGNILAIVAGVAMGVMFYAGGRAESQDERFSGLFFGQLLTGFVGLIGLTEGGFAPTPKEMIVILVLGVVQLGIPYALYAYASGGISALACSLIGMLEPMFNPVWVAIFYGEVPGVFALIGAVIIIATTAAWCVIQNRAEKSVTS